MREIYLDNSATTMVMPEVAQLMSLIMTEDYGNPSSMHNLGVKAEKYLREAKESLAKNLKVNAKEIYFTSCGTESDNLALIGTARANARRGKHLITTKIEHPAVLNAMKRLEEEGFSVTYLGTDSKGVISLDELREAVTDETILVSVMHVNNEIGSVQPVSEIGKLLHGINKDIIFHVDAVQSYGKFVINPKKADIDLLSISGHKIHASKGVGVLYINERVKIVPVLYGGGQQNGLRSGTENVPGIAGLALASKILYSNLEEETDRLYSLKENFIEGVTAIEGVSVNGPLGRDGAPHVISVSVKDVRAEVMLHSLEDKGIYVSAGSACSTHKRTPSATLTAIGLDKALLESTIRFSFSRYTTKEDIEETVKVMEELIPQLRKYTRK